MERYFKYIIILSVSAFLFMSCSKDEIIPQEVEINDFVWGGMNAYYKFQGEVNDLSDSNFSTREQLNEYLAGFENPDVLFQSLVFQPMVTDSISIITNNFNILERRLAGEVETTGMEFGIVDYRDGSGNVFGYVQLVYPNTSAANNGVTRGMIFTQVDGTTLNANNFRNLLLNRTGGYSITLADDYNNGNPRITVPGPAPVIINLTIGSLTPNPVIATNVLMEGTQKIGYLCYNEFNDQFLNELNAAFATFRSESINDLVIDLRYTSNGNIESIQTMASLIAGQLQGSIVTSEIWNNKVNTNIPSSLLQRTIVERTPTDRMLLNSLNLPRVFFLTSRATASAAEVLINGLRPLIDVVTIGETTKGVYDASTLLYDSEDYRKVNINVNHTFALFPYVAQITNRDGLRAPIEATQGLPEDYGNMGLLGERSDPMLDFAIDNIINGTASSLTPELNQLGNSKEDYITNEIIIIDLK